MKTVVGRSEDFAFINVVHAQRFQNPGFHKVADAGFGHDRNTYHFHYAFHDGRVGHAGHSARGADVGGHALQGHDGAGSGLLGDAGLFGGGDVHDDPAFEHFRQSCFETYGAVFHGISPLRRGVSRALVFCCDVLRCSRPAPPEKENIHV